MKNLMSSVLIAASIGLASAPSHAGILSILFNPKPVKSVPEIDASGAAISIALLSGIVAMRAERRKKQ